MKFRIARRELLMASAVSGSLMSLAGCIGDGETSEARPVVEHIESEIITDDEGTKWIHAEFVNPTEHDHGRIQISHSVYDSNDEVVDTQETIIDLLPAGGTWRNYELVLGDRREEAEFVESDILTDDGNLSSSEIETIEITTSTLNQGYQSGTEITGEIENGETAFSQVYLVGLVQTDEDIYRGSVGEIINDLGVNETRSFRAAIASNRTPPDRDEDLPTQHDIYVFNGIP